MAIDYGEKRVGVASTDESGSFALPRAVLDNDATLLEKVIRFKEENKIDKIILGESKNFLGEDNLIQKKILEFKTELEEKGAEVLMHPEILTTMEARQIQGQTNMTDASAAALILKSFLETMYNKNLLIPLFSIKLS